MGGMSCMRRWPARAAASGRAGGPRSPCNRRLVCARAGSVERAPTAAPVVVVAARCPGRGGRAMRGPRCGA